MLSNPLCGCLVFFPANSEGRKRPSWTRMKGSVSSYGAPRDGTASSTPIPIMRISSASSTSTASLAVACNCCAASRHLFGRCFVLHELDAELDLHLLPHPEPARLHPPPPADTPLP